MGELKTKDLSVQHSLTNRKVYVPENIVVGKTKASWEIVG
jgi:hypothetical protein